MTVPSAVTVCFPFSSRAPSGVVFGNGLIASKHCSFVCAGEDTPPQESPEDIRWDAIVDVSALWGVFKYVIADLSHGCSWRVCALSNQAMDALADARDDSEAVDVLRDLTAVIPGDTDDLGLADDQVSFVLEGTAVSSDQVVIYFGTSDLGTGRGRLRGCCHRAERRPKPFFFLPLLTH